MVHVAARKASAPPLCGSTVGCSDSDPQVHLQDKASLRSKRMAKVMGMGRMSWIDRQLAMKMTTKQRGTVSPSVWALTKIRGMEWNTR